MPIQQLGNDQGGIGSLIGAVGGFLASNVGRKDAQKQQEVKNARDTATDKRLSDEAADNHANVMSQIQDRDATATRTKSNDASAQLSTGAFQKYLPMLSSPPTVDGKPLKGPALANALTAIRNKAFTEGMTDPKHIADFNAEIARVTQADQTQGAQQFLSGEHALPGDPAQRLSTLMKRLQVERGQPGVDTKPTETMIADTQKQITEAQAAAHQNATEKRQSHHDQVMEAQGAQHIGIEQQNANRPREGRHVSAQEQYFLDHGYSPPSYGEAHPHPKAGKSVGDKDWATIQSSPAIKLLPATTKTSLQQGVSAYGVTGVVQHLNDALKTKKFPPGFNADSAQAALDALNDGE